jgi:hypothetical protein
MTFFLHLDLIGCVLTFLFMIIAKVSRGVFEGVPDNLEDLAELLVDGRRETSWSSARPQTIRLDRLTFLTNQTDRGKIDHTVDRR